MEIYRIAHSAWWLCMLSSKEVKLWFLKSMIMFHMINMSMLVNISVNFHFRKIEIKIRVLL